MIKDQLRQKNLEGRYLWNKFLKESEDKKQNEFTSLTVFLKENLDSPRISNILRKPWVQEYKDFLTKQDGFSPIRTKQGVETEVTFDFLAAILGDLNKFFECFYSMWLMSNYHPGCDKECIDFLENEKKSDFTAAMLGHFSVNAKEYSELEKKRRKEKKEKIYVIKLRNELYKIGITKNISKRFKSIKTTNPEAELITVYDGCRNQENKIHKSTCKKRIGKSEVYKFKSDKEAILFVEKYVEPKMISFKSEI
jgi:hypothetical protein